MANVFVLNVLKRLGVFDRDRRKTEPAPPGRPRADDGGPPAGAAGETLSRRRRCGDEADDR